MRPTKKHPITKEKNRKKKRKQDITVTSYHMILSILTGLCSFNGLNPLAPAFFMAINQRGAEVPLLWICSTGSIYIRLGMESAIRYGLIMLVSYFLSQMGQVFVKQEIHKKALLTGATTMVVTFIQLLWITDMESVVFQAITESFITLGFIILLAKALEYEKHRQRNLEQEELIGWMLLLSGILYGVSIPYTSTLSISQAIVWLLVAYLSYRFGMAEGALFAICFGSILYYQGEAVSFGTASAFYSAGFYALCAISCGIARKAGRFISICSMGAMAFLLFRWAQDLRVENWYGILAGSVVFLLLPSEMVSLSRQEVRKECMEEVLFLQVRNQLKGFSETLKRMKMTLLFSVGEWEEAEQKEKVLEHTVQEVCSYCEYHPYCWDTEAKLSYEQVGAVMEQVEIADNMDFVEESPFLVRCPKQQSFVTELRHSMAMQKLETIYNERILEGREAMAGQFEQVARLIDDLFIGNYIELPILEKTRMKLEGYLKVQKVKVFDVFQFENASGQREIYMTLCSEKGRMLTARELTKIVSKAFGYAVRSKRGNKSIISKSVECYGFLEESQFYYLQGVARVSKTKEEISGDNFSILEYEPGKLGVMLADGMGSGQYANKKSTLLVELMEQLLEAGFSKDASLRLLNAVLVVPVSDANFSTLDLCTIDLYKGIYHFYKVGGAFSFIKRASGVEMIRGGAIPVGIFPNLEYESYEIEVQDGDMLFLLSDGVMESVPYEDKEQFIADEIQKIKFANPQTAATKLMSRVQELGGKSNRDDITILVIGIWSRN